MGIDISYFILSVLSQGQPESVFRCDKMRKNGVLVGPFKQT
jgi:hypothetical protein